MSKTTFILLSVLMTTCGMLAGWTGDYVEASLYLIVVIWMGAFYECEQVAEIQKKLISVQKTYIAKLSEQKNGANE